ncbi:MAG: class I SAM-dependent methyltransferase, partial [Chitinispirillaceae bacterium]
MDITNTEAYYLEKENTGKHYPCRFTMEYWEKDKSYRFLKSKRKHLVSPLADFGCGHGPLSILTARFGLSVTAFDCIEDNIDNGNRLKTPDDTVEFVQCFLSDIPVPDNSFASGVCKQVLEH